MYVCTRILKGFFSIMWIFCFVVLICALLVVHVVCAKSPCRAGKGRDLRACESRRAPGIRQTTWRQSDALATFQLRSRPPLSQTSASMVGIPGRRRTGSRPWAVTLRRRTSHETSPNLSCRGTVNSQCEIKRRRHTSDEDVLWSVHCTLRCTRTSGKQLDKFNLICCFAACAANDDVHEHNKWEKCYCFHIIKCEESKCKLNYK